MSDFIIRPATPEDNEGVLALSRMIDPGDYFQEAWPAWMRQEHSVNLIARAAGQIIGCVHGEIIAPHEAWGQGIRVHPDMRQMGVGTHLLAAVEEVLRGWGVRALFGVVGRLNGISLSMFSKLGYERASQISRRKAKGKEGTPGDRSSLKWDEIFKLVSDKPILASRRMLAHFKRAYFSMTRQYLLEALNRERVRLSPDGRALALLDAEAEGVAPHIWVVALAGEPRSVKRLLENLLAEAGHLRGDLIVDSSDEPDLQRVLDELGFDLAGAGERYIVIKKTLDTDQEGAAASNESCPHTTSGR